jgi:hypothetical protein
MALEARGLVPCGSPEAAGIVSRAGGRRRPWSVSHPLSHTPFVIKEAAAACLTNGIISEGNLSRKGLVATPQLLNSWGSKCPISCARSTRGSFRYATLECVGNLAKQHGDLSLG